MSLAHGAKLAAALERVARLEQQIAALEARIKQLEDRPRPGRPKHDRNRTS